MTLQSLVRHRLRQHLDGLPAKPTQASLADAIGVTQTWVSHYLHGRHDIDLDTLERLCNTLQLDLSTIVRRDGPVESTQPPELAEPVMLLQALPGDSRAVVIELLRELTRPTTQKRARPKKR